MNPFESKNLTNTLGAVVIVILLAGIYWYFFAGVSAPDSALSTSAPLGTGPLATLTSELANVSFDTSLFSDPRFASLKDISIPVMPEPTGRTDPFAPL